MPMHQVNVKLNIKYVHYSEQYTTIPRRGGENWLIYTKTRSVEVYIHRSSPTLRGSPLSRSWGQEEERPSERG